jgi:hypothetical protein
MPINLGKPVHEWLWDTDFKGKVSLSKALKQQGWKFVGPTTVYGENDPFYSLAHSRANFDAFQAAGGTGSFAPFMV